MALPLAPPTLPDNIKAMTDDTEDKKKVEELDPETKKELEKAPQVNERPGPLDLPNAPPEKLIPLHLLKVKNENTIFKNSTKNNEVKSEKSQVKDEKKSSSRLKILIGELTSPGIEGMFGKLIPKKNRIS